MIIVLSLPSSTGGSNRNKASLERYSHDSDAKCIYRFHLLVVPSLNSSESSSKTPQEEATDPEGTTKVLAGEGEAAIALALGISMLN